MPQNQPIMPAEDAAQDWFLRLASGEVSDEDLNAFKAWRDEDSANLTAFNEIRELWNDIEILEQAFSSPTDEPQQVAVQRGQAAHDALSVVQLNQQHLKRHAGRRFAIGGLVAACLVLASVFAADIPSALTADFRTRVGEQASLTLPDGSTAHLNTDSAIAIDFSTDRRNILLLRGEALFEVQKDINRPFNVMALEGVSTAVGTVYAVRNTGDDALVSVLEGRVRVLSPASDGAGISTEAPQVYLDANEQVSYHRGSTPGPVVPVEAQATVAWRRGLVLVEDLSFAEAISEIERYRPGRILVVGDASDIDPVTARIALQEIDGGLKALATLNGLTVTQVTDYLTILH